jgi:hypothetical protein
MKSIREQGGADVNCYDVLSEVDAAIREYLAPDHQYFMLGGIASDALSNTETVMDTQSAVVLPPKSAKLSARRPTNGSRRDIDILLNTVLSESDGMYIKVAVEAAVEDTLIVSVFGVDEHIESPTRAERLRSMAVKKGWLSSRTIDEQGIQRYELFPLERVVDPASYEPWKLQLPYGGTIDVLHPAGHVLAYSMRSISGPRKKDEAKRTAMEELVLPQFKEEIVDGPFQAWQAFADDIVKLGEGWHSEEGVGLADDATPLDEGLFRLKSGFLRWGESKKGIVDFAQKDSVQRLLNPFIGAR